MSSGITDYKSRLVFTYSGPRGHPKLYNLSFNCLIMRPNTISGTVAFRLLQLYNCILMM